MKNIIFKKEENSEKYTFCVEGDENATAYLLSRTSQHRVARKGIVYAEKALLKLLDEYNPNINYLSVNNMENPIVQLAELCQKRFRKNITTRVISVDGESHSPTVTVEIELPNGELYTGTGHNQREAKKKAALEALNNF